MFIKNIQTALLLLGTLHSLQTFAQSTAGEKFDFESEAGFTATEDCKNCKDQNFADLRAISRSSDFMKVIESWNKHRELVQFPTKGELGNIGLCGAFHYSPDRDEKTGEILDNYLDPLAACAMMSLIQDWKKEHCDFEIGAENKPGCRIQWGDLSHKTKPIFNGHQRHNSGKCIDVRLMRSVPFGDEPMAYNWWVTGKDENGRWIAETGKDNPKYDRELTKKFLDLAVSKGANPVFFNDPELPFERMGGHDNHLHLCFGFREPKKSPRKPDRKGELASIRQAQKTCDEYKYDEKVCGPL